MEYSEHASLWFPPAGLTFAALLVMSWRAIPTLFVASIVSTFWMASLYQLDAGLLNLVKAGVGFFFAHVIPYFVGALLLRWQMTRLQDSGITTTVLNFLLLACLSSLVASWLGTLTIAESGLLSWAEIWDTWLPWWIGDLTGVIVLAPIFIAVISWRYPQLEEWLGGLNFSVLNRNYYSFVGKLSLILGLLFVSLLLVNYSQREEAAFAVFFLILPFLWIAYTEPAIYTALAITLFSFLLASLVPLLQLMNYALVFQFAITVIAASAWFGVSVPTLVASNLVLTERVSKDGLTQASSREFFMQRLKQQLRQAKHEQKPTALLLFDVDKFKHINDSYGHIVGDEVLVGVTATVKQQLRDGDLLGRFGGDEFMVMLNTTNLGEALETAERLRKAIACLKVSVPDIHVSCSFGIVEIAAGEHIMEAVDRADQALLNAKRAGRNCVARG